MALAILLGIFVLFIALVIFVPFLRSVLSALSRLAFFVVVVFFAVAGGSMLLYNETIFERPGSSKRAVKFMTTDSAATSEKGDGDAPCAMDKSAASAHRATANPPAQSEDDNLYDELMTRNYICEGDQPIAIPRKKLIEMAQQSVNELKGWKLLGTDERTGILNSVYTTRILGAEDEVRVLVTPKSDVELCSQSKPNQLGSLMGFFHGDFGANMGHIKEFYAAMKLKADQYCKQFQEKQKPKDPNQ